MDRPIGGAGASARRRWLVAAGAALLLAGGLAIPTLLRWSRVESSARRSDLRLGTATRGEFLSDAIAEGKVVAAIRPTLFAPSSGIVRLEAKAGSVVRKGERLATIDSPELRSRLIQESASLHAAESDLERQKIASRQLRRQRELEIDLLKLKLTAATRARVRADQLSTDGLLGAVDYEKAKDEVTIAQMTLDNAIEAQKMESDTAAFEERDKDAQRARQAAMAAEIERQLTGLTILAPCAGQVASVLVQDRDAVVPNQPLMMVVNLDAYAVEAQLTERDAANTSGGTAATIFYESKEYPGRVVAISPEVKDGQVRAELAFDGTLPAEIRQNQRVQVRLVFDRRSAVLQVPRGPFLEAGAGHRVYVVRGGEAQARDITIGAVSVTSVEIRSGLEAGDQVVLSDTTAFGNAKRILLR